MLLRRFTRPVRSLLVKLHPYVSCCASCGEIKVPLEGRLCTSLTPAFQVDGVLLGATPTDAAAVRRTLPWLRHVHACPSPRASAPAMLHELTALAESGNLAEHFFIAFPHSRLERIRIILDLFTPNGMPLLALSPAPNLPPAEAAWCDFLDAGGRISGRAAAFDNDIYPMTRECLQGFTAVYAEFTECVPDALNALARWAYASAMAVPAGPVHALSARETA